MSPRWSLAVNGQYHELYTPHVNGGRGMAGGLAATYHFDPEARLDPWLELGTGYRILWGDKDQGANTLSHGFQLARARVGLDVRLAPEIAVAPTLGADANVFLWQDAARSTAIDDPRVSLFVFAGLLGRFDIGATISSAPVVAGRAPAPPPPNVDAPTTTITSAPLEEPETIPVSPSIAVSEEILRRCQLHFDSVTKAPKFAFDQTTLLPADRETLDQIASCITTGPLQGRMVRLVGHADPRGTREHNMKLGARRASSVATFLVSAGVWPDLIEQASRGERDAKGTNEATWAIDRRVDIVLVE
jgi:peptidoglycan-associated lipoprotein